MPRGRPARHTHRSPRRPARAVPRGDRDEVHLEGDGLLGDQVEVGAGRQGDDPEAVGVARDDVQGLGADGAGGAEDGDGARGGHCLIVPRAGAARRSAPVAARAAPQRAAAAASLDHDVTMQPRWSSATSSSTPRCPRRPRGCVLAQRSSTPSQTEVRGAARPAGPTVSGRGRAGSRPGRRGCGRTSPGSRSTSANRSMLSALGRHRRDHDDVSPRRGPARTTSARLISGPRTRIMATSSMTLNDS